MGVKSGILARVALLMMDNLLWQPPPGTATPPRMLNALRYSAFQFAHLLLFGSSSNRTSNGTMLKIFGMLGGIGFLFE